MADVIIDAFIILLLTGGITFAYVMNLRVKRLMALLQELEPTVHQFSDAVDKSEASVVQMQNSIQQNQDKLTATLAAKKAEDVPQFSTRRSSINTHDVGVQVLKDKQDLVRRFFDLPKTEGRV